MTNYNNGKIYKIESSLGNMVYYGSTTKQYLSQRMTTHRNHYKYWLKGKSNNVTSYKLFEEYGLENCKIVLVENYPCNSKDELTSREAYFIRNFECVNKHVPNRTPREYYEENKEVLNPAEVLLIRLDFSICISSLPFASTSLLPKILIALYPSCKINSSSSKNSKVA